MSVIDPHTQQDQARVTDAIKLARCENALRRIRVIAESIRATTTIAAGFAAVQDIKAAADEALEQF